MIKLSKCKKCGKEVPLTGGLYDEKIIRESLCAPLDCNGNSTFDYSKLKRTKPAGQKCYWCGADILEISDRESTRTPKPVPKTTSRPQPQPRFESPTPKVVSEPKKGGETKIVIIAAFIVLIIVILLNIFF